MSDDHVRRFCLIDGPAKELLDAATARYTLSPADRDAALRVARTIADLADSDSIRTHHLAEALQYSAVRNP